MFLMGFVDRSFQFLRNPRTGWISSIGFFSPARRNTVQLGKTGTATDFLLLEIGWLSQRFAALTEQLGTLGQRR
jgi:hypothetical protein